MKLRTNSKIPALLAVAALLAAAGCRQDMHDAPYLERLEKSDFFADGRASRLPVAGTVAQGELREDAHLYTGHVNGELATAFPFAVTRDVVERGRSRYEIFCQPCHGSLGDGYGTIVQRGFQQPPSYHIDRLRSAPAGHFYNVIANGYGRMYSFNDRIQTTDRWAIVAYIRALQLSQAAPLNELPEGVVAALRAEGIQ